MAPKERSSRHAPGERVMLGLRVTPELKHRLDTAAEQTGRSQSQEAELRLERSFDREDLLSEVLTLAYGRQVAGLVMMLGTALEKTGRVAETMGAPGKDTAVVGRPNARLRTIVPSTPEAWLDSPYAFDQAAQAVAAILEAARPAGDPKPPAGSVADVAGFGQFGKISANGMLGALKGEISSSHLTREEWDKVRALLGPLAKRMRGKA